MTNKEISALEVRADMELDMLKDKARERGILAKENLELKKDIKSLKEQIEMLVKDDEESQKTIINQAERINKAIDYLNNLPTCELEENVSNLLDILRGDINEIHNKQS